MTLTATIRWCNLSAAFAIVLAFLNGCGGFDLPNPVEAIKDATKTIADAAKAEPKPNERHIFGVLASDDPAAAGVGNSILSNGGSAADAAAAMAFTMSVTYPSRAGLGGGGICMVGEGDTGKIKVLDFLPPASRMKNKGTDRPSAIPTLVRGMATLHARHGRMPWRMVIAPARDYARDGVLTSQNFSDDLAQYAVPLFADPASRTIFADGAGRAYLAGSRLRQIDLNAVLSTVAGRGAGSFYRGALARRLVEASLLAGGSLDPIELREYLPRWRDPVSVQIADSMFHASPPPATAGIIAIQMLQLALVGHGGTDTANSRAHLIAEAAKRSVRERTNWLGDDFGVSANLETLLSAEHASEVMQSFSEESANPAKYLVDKDRVPSEKDANVGFIVADGDGLMIACSLSMYHPFGTGRTMPGLGILLAPAPDGEGRNALSLGPVVVTRITDNVMRFAFTGSGGAVSSTAMANVMIGVLLARKNLVSAVSRARIHYAAARDEIIIEDQGEKGQLDSLTALGHKVRRLTKVGRVNAISCPSGLPAPEPTCDAVADPRGDGLATKVNFFKEVW